MTQMTTSILPSQTKPSQAKPSLSWRAACRVRGPGRLLRRLPVNARCGIGAQHVQSVIHGHPLLIAAHAYPMRAMSLNGMDLYRPRLMKHCRSGALAANRCDQHAQVRCEGAAPTAHPALFHVKRHGFVPAPTDETRGSLDAAKRNPGTCQSASLLAGYETAPQRHGKRCNSRRETVVCPLFPLVKNTSNTIAASAGTASAKAVFDT